MAGATEAAADGDEDPGPSTGIRANVAVIGGFDDLVVDVDLGGVFHALTVGAARKAYETGVVERHEG